VLRAVFASRRVEGRARRKVLAKRREHFAAHFVVSSLFSHFFFCRRSIFYSMVAPCRSVPGAVATGSAMLSRARTLKPTPGRYRSRY
jgi:hypothetical protein